MEGPSSNNGESLRLLYGDTLRLQVGQGARPSAMTPQTVPDIPPHRPQRADARRNYEKLVSVARDVFAEHGTSATLDDIARRAEVGPATLYRHFPTRQHLLEAVYLDEVEAMSRSAADLAELPPWDALVQWLREFVRYAATKRALAQEMLNSIDRDAEVFRASRAAIMGAGDALLKRAQDAGLARPDAGFTDVARLLGGIAGIPGAEPAEVERLLDIVLDGLRYQGEPKPA
jgi:AcrR family transcriptional regulator